MFWMLKYPFRLGIIRFLTKKASGLNLGYFSHCPVGTIITYDTNSLHSTFFDKKASGPNLLTLSFTLPCPNDSNVHTYHIYDIYSILVGSICFGCSNISLGIVCFLTKKASGPNLRHFSQLPCLNYSNVPLSKHHNNVTYIPYNTIGW